MSAANELKPLTRKDFESNQDVRWCPGCGDYALLAQIQRLLPTLGIPRENFAFISGIGCASRFPYYMETYGMHSIHGRAPAVATGLKVARPDLSVWVVTGDGDALAIGGNHFIHAMRRNVGIKVILLNNRIYGLTKGQSSPTSELGKTTKSTPFGNIDRPFSPVAIALAAGATFAARTMDSDPQHMLQTLRRAAEHDGTAFVEVLQNCIVFNDGAYDFISDRGRRADATLLLQDGKPLVYGKENNRGIGIRGLEPEVVAITDGDATVREDIVIHDEQAARPSLAFLLAQLEPPWPVPMGVFRAVRSPTYEELSRRSSDEARATNGDGALDDLLNSGESWSVK